MKHDHRNVLDTIKNKFEKIIQNRNSKIGGLTLYNKSVSS